MTPTLTLLLLFLCVLVSLSWLGVRRDVLGAVALVVILLFVARLMGLV